MRRTCLNGMADNFYSCCKTLPAFKTLAGFNDSKYEMVSLRQAQADSVQKSLRIEQRLI